MKFLFSDKNFPSKETHSQWRFYKTQSDAKRARTLLIKRGWNYFTFFQDVRGPALEFGKVEWVQNGQVWTNW